MGGSYALSNMEPTHKICNNKRGTEPVYGRGCGVKFNIEIRIDFEHENPKYRPTRFRTNIQYQCHCKDCR